MIRKALSFITWNALVLLRLPLRALFTVMAFLCLMMVIAAVIALPFGGVGDTPLWVQLLIIVVFAAGFALWSGLMFFYDTLIFRLTPDSREIILGD